MKKYSLYLLSFLFLNLSNSSFSQLAVGEIAAQTDVEMKATDGKSYSLKSSLKENGVLVIFTCNTCPFIVGSSDFEGWEKSYPEICDLAKKLNVGVLFVNSNAAKRDNEDSPSEMKKRAKKMNYAAPYVVDENAFLADAWKAKTTPHVYLLDKEFKLVYAGAINNAVEADKAEPKTYLMDALNELALDKPVTVSNTPPRGCSIKRIKK